MATPPTVRSRNMRSEDVYLMSRRFAETHNWFLKGHHLYFEDIHFCQQPGVCELGPILARADALPRVLQRPENLPSPASNVLISKSRTGRSRIFFLKMETDDPVIRSLQFAVREHRRGAFSLSEALRYSRKNSSARRYSGHELSLPHSLSSPHVIRTWCEYRSTIFVRPLVRFGSDVPKAVVHYADGSWSIHGRIVDASGNGARDVDAAFRGLCSAGSFGSSRRPPRSARPIR